ncbi:neurosecretory protein VGF [Lampris incognitus]|uniref:neurosecretory protein VGF n=1 Tax=Lampris incognitus TaxID=2546036 RepID=UPI0024B5FFEA|nr:neurosecretory protein VGF [Lampris incognitus]
MGEEGGSVEKEGERVEEHKEERKDELFNDVDPKILAAVLLEALNMPHTERKREWGWGNETEKEEQEGRKDANQEQEKGGDEKATEEDRKKDDQMLALLMTATSAQGRDEQEREEDERRKVQEEEMLTEKVMSHTTSQTVPVKMQQQSTTENGEGEEMLENEQGSTTLDEPQQQGEQRNDEEEYQLSPEELKNLESMMKEFQSLTTAVKRKGDSMRGQRERRGYSPFNDVLPKIKDYDLAMSKMKLKWQEETQKAMNFPSFLGGSFMEVAEDNDLNNALSDPAHPLPPPEDDLAEEDVPDMEVEEEDILSPEEEEAQAKAEQEEVRRQATEAQRAKMEEEKLADIASDMLLQYMAKQNSGNKREKEQMWKYSSSLPNTAEDKRSDEKQEVMGDNDDDIDPQTIDKLIEISSKLHLPADDVVDIIGDVEKKKKKDVQPETASLSSWQQTLMPQSSLPSTNGISVSKITANQKGFPLSKQTTVNPLKISNQWTLGGMDLL